MMRQVFSSCYCVACENASSHFGVITCIIHRTYISAIIEKMTVEISGGRAVGAMGGPVPHGILSSWGRWIYMGAKMVEAKNIFYHIVE